MKAEPTDLDREAATLFAPAPGMRVHAWGRWVRVATDDYGLRECDEVVTDAHSSVGVDALDTDDHATVGCMLAQVEDAAGARVDLVWQWRGRGVIEYVAQWQRDDDIGVGRNGSTRGAALVAAMKAIKGAK